MIVRSIGVLSFAKAYAVIMAAFGVVGGLFMSLTALLGVAGAGGDATAGILGILFGVDSLIFFPLFYGILGFVGGALMAWVYNVAASVVGGIQLNLVEAPPAGSIGLSGQSYSNPADGSGD